MSHLPPRPHYRPSGRIRPGRTLIALFIMAIVSLTSGGVLCAIFSVGFCMPLMWMIVPALITWLASYGLHLAHCRNRCLAVALTFVCGLGGYLTYFHIDQCVHWKTPWTAVDRLPGYIVFRMQTDQSFGGVDQALDPAPGVVPWRPAAAARPNVNWILFLLDLLPLAIASIPRWRWAGLPYSERRRQWTSPTMLHFAPAAGQALEQALAERTVADWVESDPQRVETHLPHYSVTLWFVGGDGQGELDADVYLQIGREAFQLLDWDETGALAALFPELQEIAGPARERLAEQAREMDGIPTAEIWPVPADDPARRAFWWTEMLTCGVYFLVLFGPPVLAYVCLLAGLRIIQLLFIPQIPPPNWLAIPVLLSVPVFMELARRWINANNGVPICIANRVSRWRLVGAFAQRKNSLLAGHADDAIMAEMRPRKTWNALGAASVELNRGLLLLDVERRLILFEGERENYVIPAEAIISGRVEALSIQEVTQTSFHAVVLKVQLGEGVWELPFLPLAVKMHANNWHRAKLLLYVIDVLCGRKWSQETNEPPKTLEAAAKYAPRVETATPLGRTD